MTECSCNTTRRPQLIAQWRRSWQLTSVQAAAVLAFLNIINVEVLPLFNFTIPANWMSWINALLGISIIALRIVVQPSMVITPPQPTQQEPPHNEQG